MDTLTRFLEYATAFEATYDDDNWERLRPFWCEDAVYEVVSTVSPCRLVGPDAIFAGTKKCLDGFDRCFDKRELDLPKPPVVNGDEMSADWLAIYSKSGVPTFTLPGNSKVVLRDGKIAAVTDSFTGETEAALGKWIAEAGMNVSLAYA